MASRISARCTAGITEVSTVPLSPAMAFSRSAPSSASHALTCALIVRAVSSAAAAAPLVAPTIRRTPFAMPSSERRTKSVASEVFARCVPPQNSMEYPFQSSASGVASRSSMDGPTETTRTGSGYTSPKTARSPEMAFALSSATSRVCTESAALTWSRTSASTFLISSADIALECEKSNRSFSSSTSEPFWSTESPRTWRRAWLSTWVMVWLGMMLFRRSWSTRVRTASPTAMTPSTDWPT
mmetsp:Transcript_8414/g.37928  ORF Transcript_8414/g.37928 Transcript_8414/m.37928 type:complete len:241 (-) Transcript_8414:1905-2627(-)